MARDLVSPLRRLGSAGPSTLVATLVDLGDRGLTGSFRRSTAFRVPWYQHGSSTRDSRLMAASGTSDLAASTRPRFGTAIRLVRISAGWCGGNEAALIG